MTILTVTAKGQITLRKDVLKHLGIGPGGKIDCDLLPDGTMIARAVTPERTGSIENFFGMLASPEGPHLTIEEIKEASEEGWASAMDYDKDRNS